MVLGTTNNKITIAETHAAGLMIIFAIVVGLALIGSILGVLLGTDNTLIQEAMRIVGYGGPAGNAANTAAQGMFSRGAVRPPGGE